MTEKWELGSGKCFLCAMSTSCMYEPGDSCPFVSKEEVEYRYAFSCQGRFARAGKVCNADTGIPIQVNEKLLEFLRWLYEHKRVGEGHHWALDGEDGKVQKVMDSVNVVAKEI